MLRSPGTVDSIGFRAFAPVPTPCNRRFRGRDGTLPDKLQRRILFEAAAREVLEDWEGIAFEDGDAGAYTPEKGVRALEASAEFEALVVSLSSDLAEQRRAALQEDRSASGARSADRAMGGFADAHLETTVVCPRGPAQSAPVSRPQKRALALLHRGSVMKPIHPSLIAPDGFAARPAIGYLPTSVLKRTLSLYRSQIAEIIVLQLAVLGYLQGEEAIESAMNETEAEIEELSDRIRAIEAHAAIHQADHGLSDRAQGVVRALGPVLPHGLPIRLLCGGVCQ